MKRRDVLFGGLALGAGLANTHAQAPIPAIDTHIHLFDARRPQGVPYAGSKDYRGGVALPSMYRELAEPLGVAGAIVIEASPWIEDNLWVLETIESSSFIVGFIGNLQPAQPEFADYLDRYRKNRLFLGIRHGNNWGYDIVEQARDPAFIAGLARLAQADLVFEAANPRLDLLRTVLTISDKLPELRIVVDHMPSLDPTPAAQAEYDSLLRDYAGRRKIFVKLSQIVHRERLPDGTNGIRPGLAAHRERLDQLMEIFGEDRVMFGSDWPNSIGITDLPDIMALTREYFAGRGSAAAEKYFWKNSISAYKWRKRMPQQPGPT